MVGIVLNKRDSGVIIPGKGEKGPSASSGQGMGGGESGGGNKDIFYLLFPPSTSSGS